MSSSSQTYFQDAHHFNVQNSQINSVGPHGNLTVINSQDAVSTILWPHVAPGAMFDSAERYAAGKCHPGTRERIIERITQWIADSNTTHRVLWLHGPAGGGKSAVEHTMCEILKQQHPESYGASFFFRSGDRDRGNATKLFTTLAYQLAIHFPSFRSKINDALCHDRSLPTKSMEIQFLSLIGQPLLDCQDHLSHSPILVVDGLDECADDEGTDTQRNIIILIGKFIVEYNLPLRILVASRPECWIRDAFDTAPLSTITQVLSLRNDEDADKDIKAYLIDGFEKIFLENKTAMTTVVLPWPPEEIIDHFVYQASGQYIYASTVLRFVGKSSRFIKPQKQLAIITSNGPHHALAFSDLDRLYVTILFVYPELETMQRVLGGLLVGANASIITATLGVNPDDVALVLDALSSLIVVQKPRQLRIPEDHLSDLESIFGCLMEGRDKISFCHLSFREFITDKTRSGAFHVDLEAIRHEIVMQFFDMIIHCKLDQKYEIGPHRFVKPYYFGYNDSIVLIAYQCLRDLDDDTQYTLLSQLVDGLAAFNPGSRSPNSLLSFIRGLEDLLYSNGYYIDTWTEEFRDALYLAWKRAIDALSLCSAFKVTPALVYLAECVRDFRYISMDELSTIPGTVDLTSTIRQHHHFLRLPDVSRYFPSAEDEYLGRNGGDEDHIMLFKRINTLGFVEYLSRHPEKGSRIESEWNAGRIFLVHQYLKFILNSNTYDCHSASSFFLARCFFSEKEIADICTKEYLQNSLSVLTLMTDLELWTRFHQIHGSWDSDPLIASVYRWFHRQLTNEKALGILQDHDKSFPQKMTTIMTFIFERSLLPHLSRFYTEGICILSIEASRILKVLPLPRGIHLDKERHNSIDDDWGYLGWDSFLDEVFEDKETKSPIDPICWYPLLASRLLFTLVRFLYGQIDRYFSTSHHRYDKAFPYLTQCLLYAEPTPKNLDAIRAIVYLYGGPTEFFETKSSKSWGEESTWKPPEDLWLLIGEFLQRYNRSDLSSEELELFMVWLESPDHENIAKYTTIK